MPEQAQIDFRRGDQLAALRHAELPVVFILEGNIRRRITPRDMVAVLRAIDDHGSHCWASLETIAKEARMGRQQVVRVIRALTGQGATDDGRTLGLLAMGKRTVKHKRSGGWVNTYAIVWPELASYCGDRLRLAANTVPKTCEHRTQNGQHRTQNGQHRTHVGTGSVTSEASQEAPHRLSVPADADGDDDGRKFSGEALEEIRRLANELAAWLPCERPDNRELVAKLATLRAAGELSEADWQDLLESFRVKRAARDLPKKPAAWIWARLRQRLGDGVLERLLARCKVPRELLRPPGNAALEACP